MKKLFAFGLCSSVFLSAAYCQSRFPFASDRLRIQDAVIPVYAGDGLEPAAVVRADSVHTEFERKGFFRIGVLPVAVMEGVTIEVRQPERAAESLAQVSRWFEGGGVKRMELRRVKFRIAPSSANCLEAGRGAFIAGGCLELLDDVRFGSGTNVICAPRATLQVTGRNAGQIVLLTTPPRTNNFFLIPPVQAQPKENQNESR